jgi:hypothetical protein
MKCVTFSEVVGAAGIARPDGQSGSDSPGHLELFAAQIDALKTLLLERVPNFDPHSYPNLPPDENLATTYVMSLKLQPAQAELKAQRDISHYREAINGLLGKQPDVDVSTASYQVGSGIPPIR